MVEKRSSSTARVAPGLECSLAKSPFLMYELEITRLMEFSTEEMVGNSSLARTGRRLGSGEANQSGGSSLWTADLKQVAAWLLG